MFRYRMLSAMPMTMKDEKGSRLMNNLDLDGNHTKARARETKGSERARERKGRSLLETLVESSKDSIVSHDLDGRDRPAEGKHTVMIVIPQIA